MGALAPTNAQSESPILLVSVWVDHSCEEQACLRWANHCAMGPGRRSLSFGHMLGTSHNCPTPSVPKVADADGKESFVEAEHNLPLPLGNAYDLWGIHRQARNVDPSTTTSPQKYALVEQGLHRLLESLPRVVADSAEVMFMIEGQCETDAQSIRRSVGLFTGTSYNPKVFDVTINEFVDEAVAHSSPLVLPFLVRLSTRAHRVSDHFSCVDCQTGAEYAAFLERSFGIMRLFRLTYEVMTEIDGSLCYSNIIGMQDLGVLWEPGQKKPWGRAGALNADRTFTQHERLMNTLESSDPLADVVDGSSIRSSKRRAVGQGGDKRSHNPMGASGSAHPSSVGGPLLPALPRDPNPPGDPQPKGPHLPMGVGQVEERYLDMLEDEGELLDDEDIEELAVAYSSALEGHNLPNRAIDDVVDRASATLAPDVADEATVAEVTAIFEETAEAVVLSSDLQPGEPSSASAPSASAADEHQSPTADQLPPPPPLLWQQLIGPSASGYVYLDGRAVMRIQRGKPTGRLTLSCYRHTRCSMLINLDRAPSDETLKQWLFEVEPTPPDSSKEARQTLTKRHLDLARSQWTAKRR